MSTKIDFRTLPANVPVMCIPRVYSNISESRIRRIFDDLDMGIIDRIDMVSKQSDKGEKFNRVFIHFHKWNKTPNACEARERLLNGKEIKIIYDEPWFWKISAYREAERKPQQQPEYHHHPKVTIQFDSDDERPSIKETRYQETRFQEKPRKDTRYQKNDTRPRRRDESPSDKRPQRQETRPPQETRPLNVVDVDAPQKGSISVLYLETPIKAVKRHILPKKSNIPKLEEPKAKLEQLEEGEIQEN